jgi:hypothetical protein
VEWDLADTFLATLDADALRTLLGILTSRQRSAPVRSGDYPSVTTGADLAELLIELEEKEWARPSFVERVGNPGD